jgi:uncharacterized protein YcbK (DUF882 family)
VLIAGLEELRARVGLPLIVVSGFRCLKYNATLANASAKSQHCLGRAADVRANHLWKKDHPPVDAAWLKRLAEKVEVFRGGGIGMYDGWLHVDVRANGPARWDKRRTIDEIV